MRMRISIIFILLIRKKNANKNNLHNFVNSRKNSLYFVTRNEL